MDAHLRRQVVLSEPLAQTSAPALRQANRRHDVVAIQIIGPHEEQLPALGRMTLEDAETGEVGEINLRNEKELAAFVHHRVAAQEELEKQFRGMNIDHLRLRTGEPYMPELTKFFRMRLDRQRRP